MMIGIIGESPVEPQPPPQIARARQQTLATFRFTRDHFQTRFERRGNRRRRRRRKNERPRALNQVFDRIGRPRDERSS